MLKEEIICIHEYTNYKAELLRSIRHGEYELEEIKEMLVNYEKQAKVLYDTGTLQYSSNIKELEELLIECLEMKFGKI